MSKLEDYPVSINLHATSVGVLVSIDQGDDTIELTIEMMNKLVSEWNLLKSASKA